MASLATSKEWFDYYESGTRDSDYGSSGLCDGSTDTTDCSSLIFTHNDEFRDFTGNQSSMNTKLPSETDMYLNLTHSFDMSSFFPPVSE